jgi:arylformamidase
LVGTGLVIDLRPLTERWALYRLDQVLANVPEPIREEDIVILYTGWERYNWTKETRNDVMYFAGQPGPHPEVIDYLISKKVKWIGTDLASMDHALCTRLRLMRPDLVEEYETMTGKSIEQTLPKKWFDGNHYKTARNNVPMVENLGGDLAQIASRRVTLGAFPWRWVGGEGCICRVAAFLEDVG